MWDSKTKPQETLEEKQEIQEETQKIVTFDDIVGPFDELNYGEKDIFFLYLHEVENRAHELSMKYSREALEKAEKEAQKKKQQEQEEKTESDHIDTPSSSDEDKQSNTDNDIQPEKTSEDRDPTATQESQDGEVDDWLVFQYAKQLTRENWPTIFTQVREVFPNVDFTGFDEYTQSDWDTYLQKMHEENPEGINILTSEQKEQWEKWIKMLYVQ